MRTVPLSVALATAVVTAAAGFEAGLPDAVCDDRHRLEAQLRTGNGSMKAGFGLHDPETLVEIWTNPASGEWTLVRRYSNETSCIIAMGEAWQPLDSPSTP